MVIFSRCCDTVFVRMRMYVHANARVSAYVWVYAINTWRVHRQALKRTNENLYYNIHELECRKRD